MTQKFRIGPLCLGLMILPFGLNLLADSQAGAAIPPTAVPAVEPSVQQDLSSAYYHFFRAMDLITRGNYTEADGEFKNAIEANPRDANLLVEYARFLLQTQNLSEAHRQLEQALQIEPDQVEAHRLLAGLYASSVGEGSPDEKVAEISQKAIAEYEEVLRLSPDDPESLFAIGRLYFRTQNLEKAEEYLKRFTAQAGTSIEGFYYLTLSYIGQKKYEQALETLDNMERLRPESMQIQLMKADILENLDRHEAAERLYQRQIEAAPGESAPYLQYARMLLKNQQNDRAVEILEKAQANSAADEDVLSLLGQVYRDRHAFDKAIQAFKDAIALAPSILDTRYQLGLTYVDMGDAQGAIPVFQALVRDTDQTGPAVSRQEASLRRMFLINLGFLYMDIHKYMNALEVFADIQKSFPDDREPLVFLQMAEAFRNLDQPERALKVIEEGLNRMPDDQRLLNERGIILVSTGQAEQAVQELKGRLGEGSADAQAYLGLSAVYAETKQWESAVRTADEGLKKFENHPNLLFQKASVLERSGKYKASEEVFQHLLEVDPDNDNAMNYLGYMLIDYDLDVDRGLKLVQQALVYEPKNPAYLDSLGWGYHKKKDYKKALEYLQQASRSLPDDPTLLEHLGDVNRAMGRTHEARDFYEKALPLTKDTAEKNRLRDKIKLLKPKLQV
jgi:tetratricopeptide (TPR) repeat protein